MRHVNYSLTPAKLNAAKPKNSTYKLADGGGLFVRVSTAGTRTWCYAYTFGTKRREVTFGQYPEIGVKEARDRHLAARTKLANGDDPAAAKKEEKEAQRRAAEASEGVFRRFSEVFLVEQLGDASEGYRERLRARLDLHVWPHIGTKQLTDVKPRDVLEIMERLRKTPVTAEKVRALIAQIFDHAIRKLRVETNPAHAMRGVVKVPASTHHRHLSEPELGTFWRALAKHDDSATYPSTVACARIIALTMCRKCEAVAAKWTEFDLDEGTWTIPGERMKMRKPHRVFLPSQAVTILLKQKELTGGGEYVFATFAHRKTPPNVSTVTNFFDRLEGVPGNFTPHGLRGTAATILREHGFRRDVVELLLAHGERGVASAYHHHELAEERREALQHYADLVDSLAAGADVIGLKRRRAA
ncbi:tyrosine-type recombinase/integrase [Paraburkholderia phosphatilytica]|uniref:tyrosine-type recombinase/integrase n=1 Tax=Paraburkholderia phosphatilytica TaxID=2282883 RepID=UPI000E494704|nr:integrase arm-type DNA-binding domain-containing protein [Paraburkholderia phosphatilytica]